jgi:hypothetical protein
MILDIIVVVSRTGTLYRTGLKRTRHKITYEKNREKKATDIMLEAGPLAVLKQNVLWGNNAIPI